MTGLVNTADWQPVPVRDAFLLTEATPGVPGRAIQIRASGAGTVTLTLLDGSTIPVTVPTGVTVLPYMVTKATVGTATITSYYNLLGMGTSA